jgi:hypothetical protein
MSGTTAGWLQFALLVAALAVCYVPPGNYIAHIFTTDKDWAVERGDRGGASRPARTDAGPARKLEHRLICRRRDRRWPWAPGWAVAREAL